MNFKNKKILVAGGAGFIGSHLVDALVKKGSIVSVIDNLSTGRKENLNSKIRFYQNDLNDPKVESIFKKERPEIVYSLAFNTDVRKSVADPVFDIQSLVGNVRMMDFSRKHGVKKIIFSSSGFVYGNTPSLPTPEDEPSIPENPYIISKSSSENYLEFYHRTHNLDYVVLRYATVYGPRQTRGAMADYIRSIHADSQAAIYGDGSKTRDYVFVDDVVRANLAAAEFKKPPSVMPVFNIGTGKETSLNSLYKKIAILLQKPHAMPEYKPDQKGDLMRFRLSNKKAYRCLKWKPQTPLDKGLEITIKHFLEKSPR